MKIKIKEETKQKIKNGLKYFISIIGSALSIITKSSFDDAQYKNYYYFDFSINNQVASSV